MIIAGGDWQVPLTQRAKQFGAFVINSNLHKDSPAFHYADATAVADVRDFNANLKIAQKYRPDAILTDQSDIAVPTVAKLCDTLGLKGIGASTAETFTNKLAMRKICSRLGHPTPRYHECRSLNDVIDLLKSWNVDVVIKPLDSQSSRGVYKLSPCDDPTHAFNNALSHSGTKSVLIEEFIPGTELTVEGIKLPDKHTVLAISIKRHFEHNPMVADRLLYPSELEGIDSKRLIKQHAELIEAMNLPFGLTHAEYKMYGERFFLIEVAARGGGTKIASHIVPSVSGVDTYDALIKLSLGQEGVTINPNKTPKAAILEFLECPPGRVAQILGIDQARTIQGILDIHLNFAPGDVIKQSKDDRSRHMHVIACSETTDEVISAAKLAQSQIEISYARDSDI